MLGIWAWVVPICIGPILVIIVVAIALRLARPLIWRRRDARFNAVIPLLEDQVAMGRYNDALNLIETNQALHYHHRLSPVQEKRVVELESTSLEAIGRTEDALILVSGFLSMRCRTGEWPGDLLHRWLALYASVRPLPIEKFYVCPHCGLESGTRDLLNLAVSRGLPAPLGFSSDMPVVHEMNIFGAGRR